MESPGLPSPKRTGAGSGPTSVAGRASGAAGGSAPADVLVPGDEEAPGLVLALARREADAGRSTGAARRRNPVVVQPERPAQEGRAVLRLPEPERLREPGRPGA